MNKDNVIKATTYYTLGSVISASLSFIFIPLFMAEFSVEEYGVYSLILIISSVLSAIFYLGVTSALNRSYFDYENCTGRNNCFYTTLCLLMIGASLQIFFGFIFSSKISYLVFDNYEWVFSIRVVSISGSLTFINFAFLTYLRLNNEPESFFVYSLFSAFANLFFMSVFVLFLKMGVNGAILSVLISQAIVFLVFFIAKYKLILNSRFLFDESKIQLKYGFFTVVSSFSGLAILWADQFFINKYLSLSDVGVYALAVKLAGVITVIFITPYIQVFNPIAMEQRESSDSGHVIMRFYKMYIMLSFVLSVMFSFFLEELVYFFDKDGGYLSAIPYVLPLMLSLCVFGAVNIVGIGFSFERKLFGQTFIYIVFAFLNVWLNIVLIPMLHVVGAVLSTLITYSLVTVTLAFFSNKLFKLSYCYYFTMFMVFVSIFMVYINSYFITDLNFLYRLLFKIIVVIGLFVFSWFFIKNNFSILNINPMSSVGKKNT
ncbi:oligosaccharide flippase family protein [Vibrio aestuarianus]|uniref:oligosaccharide flippase family protein n=1 Tax=Vibrio aestuarianus TaxID=28171 RepID=UPI00237C605A|nr:oligosaccharide flippase family protein [Vibrio aestuarianus]MDE1326592.1 oligosaccharide flippase family protein [Vibrio aestuarianus]